MCRFGAKEGAFGGLRGYLESLLRRLCRIRGDFSGQVSPKHLPISVFLRLGRLRPVRISFVLARKSVVAWHKMRLRL